MFATLDGYLQATTTPERRTMILRACTQLVESGVTDHQFLIENELAVADQLDADFVTSLVDGILVPVYRNVLGEFGVRLVDTARLDQFTDVLQALHNVDNYADSESVYQRCESTEGSEAALADVLELLGAEHATEYLTILEYVSPRLLERIQELHQTETPDQRPIPEYAETARARLKAFLESAPAQVVTEPLVLRALEDGAHLGDHVFNLLTPYLNAIEAMSPQQIAVEMVAFHLASDIQGNDVLHSVIMTTVEKYMTVALPQITQIDIAVRRLLQVNHAQA